MATASADARFGAKLQRELARQDLGIRTLARRIDQQNAENWRRNIYRWLGGVSPEPEHRETVAVALGLDAHALDDDEDEESEAEMRLDSLLQMRLSDVIGMLAEGVAARHA